MEALVTFGWSGMFKSGKYKIDIVVLFRFSLQKTMQSIDSRKNKWNRCHNELEEKLKKDRILLKVQKTYELSITFTKSKNLKEKMEIWFTFIKKIFFFILSTQFSAAIIIFDVINDR